MEWEVKVLEDADVDTLNDEGRDGWEPVHIWLTDPGKEPNYLEYQGTNALLKRRKKADTWHRF